MRILNTFEMFVDFGEDVCLVLFSQKAFRRLKAEHIKNQKPNNMLRIVLGPTNHCNFETTPILAHIVFL